MAKLTKFTTIWTERLNLFMQILSVLLKLKIKVKKTE